MGWRDDTYNKSAAVTPSDATKLDFDALYIGGLGAVAIKHDEDAGAVTFAAVPAGTVLPLRGVRVMSTGTTATNIVALKR